MTDADWVKAGIDLLQAMVSGVFVGLVIYWLDERRAKRDRRLSDFRLASNWSFSEPKISLRNFDLTKSNLSGYEFVKANLERATLFNSSNWATNFSEANLRHVDFRKSVFVGCKFIGANLRGADFSGALIRKGTEHNTISDFTGADLRKSKFISAKLSNVILAKADLTFVDFNKAYILNCDFTEADLTGSHWKSVRKVENCIWKNVKVDTSENIPKYLWEEIQRQNMPIKRKKRVER